MESQVYAHLITALITTGIWSFVAFLAKDSIRTWVTRSISLKFDIELEELRSSLKTQEHILQANLRAREDELSNLHKSILSVTQSRHSELDRRRMEAAEKVWEMVLSMRHGLTLLMFMSRVRIEEALEGSKNDPSTQQAFKNVEKTFPFNIDSVDKLGKHEIYVSPRVKSAINAYFQPIASAKLLCIAMAEGVDKKVINLENIHKQPQIRKVLPHWCEALDKFGFLATPDIMAELETEILAGLSEMVDGTGGERAVATQFVSLARMMEQSDTVRKLEQTIPRSFIR